MSHIQFSRVKPASGCKKQNKSVFMNVVDKVTKKNSVIFDLDEIRWIGETEADVTGGYLCASMCMAGGVYHALRDQSGWHVTRFDAQVMS